jgi:hypothetical protein
MRPKGIYIQVQVVAKRLECKRPKATINMHKYNSDKLNTTQYHPSTRPVDLLLLCMRAAVPGGTSVPAADGDSRREAVQA